MAHNQSCLDFIAQLPKAELHVHLEGTLTAAQYYYFAQRNGISIYTSEQAIEKECYAFSDLSSFITAYKKVQEVLCTEQDFYDLTMSYLKKAYAQGIVHCEIFFDIQSHMLRGIMPATIINGMHHAFIDAHEQFGISAAMIMCIMRDLSQDSALQAFAMLDEFKSKVIGIGLAGVEKDNQPFKFEQLFAIARQKGYHIVAHAGEECGPDYIRDAIVSLQPERIDHGISCMRDPSLVTTLALTQLPMTVCPLSNIALGYASSIGSHPVKAMFDAGIMITINSDNPAFFKSNCSDNYKALAQEASFSCKDLVICAQNSIRASFCDDQMKRSYLVMIDEYAKQHTCVAE